MSNNNIQEHVNPMSSELEWIKFRQDTLGDDAYEQSPGSKLIERIKENPIVPFGALMTTAALGYGLISMIRGDRKMSQYMMRSRIFAQAFTVVALICGVTLGTSNFTPPGKNSSKKTEEVAKNV